MIYFDYLLEDSEEPQVNKMDGCKLVLPDDGWFLIRPSGTEPIVRCYGEAQSPKRLEAVMQAGHDLLKDALK